MNPIDPIGGFFNSGFTPIVNPDIVDGLEQIENEQAFLDRKIYENARRRIQKVENNLARIDAKIANNLETRIQDIDSANKARDATIISSLKGELETIYSYVDIQNYCTSMMDSAGVVSTEIAMDCFRELGYSETEIAIYSKEVSTNPFFKDQNPNLWHALRNCSAFKQYCLSQPPEPPIEPPINDPGLDPSEFLTTTACDFPTVNIVQLWLHRSIYPNGNGFIRWMPNYPKENDHLFIWVPGDKYTNWGITVGGLQGYIPAKAYAQLKCIFGTQPPYPPEPPLPPNEPPIVDPPIDPCLPCEPPIVLDPKPPITDKCCPVNVTVNVPKQDPPIVNVSVNPGNVVSCPPNSGDNNNSSIHPVTVNVPPTKVEILPIREPNDPSCGDRNELQYFLSECGQAELDAYWDNMGFGEKYPLKNPVNYDTIKKASTANGFQDLEIGMEL
jgi:hypothetical protein